jgi:hypothetical protein
MQEVIESLSNPQVSEIGYSLATAGIVAASLQIVFMPYLLRTYPSVKIYNFAMSMWWLPFVCLPLINLVARAGYDPSTGTVGTSTLAILWVCLAGTMLTARFGQLAYSSVVILVDIKEGRLTMLCQGEHDHGQGERPPFESKRHERTRANVHVPLKGCRTCLRQVRPFSSHVMAILNS